MGEKFPMSASKEITVRPKATLFRERRSKNGEQVGKNKSEGK